MFRGISAICILCMAIITILSVNIYSTKDEPLSNNFSYYFNGFFSGIEYSKGVHSKEINSNNFMIKMYPYYKATGLEKEFLKSWYDYAK